MGSETPDSVSINPLFNMTINFFDAAASFSISLCLMPSVCPYSVETIQKDF
jgi:hypothetical protein